MLAVLSPSRNVRPPQGPLPEGVVAGRPVFLEEALRLAEALRGYSPWELESLLDAGPSRAMELYDSYRRFSAGEPGTPALLSYVGAAFRNLNPQEFDREEFGFAQEHLRIISAFYGLLRPADGILPYRLGLSRSFRVEGGTLPEFWGDKVYRELFREGDVVVSLTSPDYLRLVKPWLRAGDRLITCRFLVQKPDGARGTVSSVRMARGQMARFLVKNRVGDPEGLQDFDWGGYRFIPGRSNENNYVFITS